MVEGRNPRPATSPPPKWLLCSPILGSIRRRTPVPRRSRCVVVRFWMWPEPHGRRVPGTPRLVQGAMTEMGQDASQADLRPFSEPGACRLILKPRAEAESQQA